jgi:hypothetical protein
VIVFGSIDMAALLGRITTAITSHEDVRPDDASPADRKPRRVARKLK